MHVQRKLSSLLLKVVDEAKGPSIGVVLTAQLSMLSSLSWECFRISAICQADPCLVEGGRGQVAMLGSRT